MDLTLVLTALVLLFILHYIVQYYRNVARLPPGPFPLPFVGNYLQMNTKTLRKDLSRLARQYGPIFTVYMPGPVVFLSSYDAFREAMLDKGDDFSVKLSPPNKEYQFCDNPGIVASNGESWKANRRVAVSILRDFGMGKGRLEEQIQMSVVKYLDYVESINDKSHVDLRWAIQLLTSNIINELLFGFIYTYDNAEPLLHYVQTFNALLRDLYSSKLRYFALKFPWLKKLPIIRWYAVGVHAAKRMEMRKFVTSSYKRAMESYQPDAEPECFVHAYAQKIGTNPYITWDQLLANCDDFFFAGQETTTTTIRWLFLYLASNQDVQDRVRAEIVSVVGHDRLPSMVDRPSLPYTLATIHEVNRHANLFAINFRIMKTDSEVMGHKIPNGVLVNLDTYLIMEEDPIFENSSKFKPERYLLDDGKTFNKEAVERTVPFGLGKRHCVGEWMAVTEILMMMAATVQRYRILPTEDKPIDLEAAPSAIRAPKDQFIRLVKVDP